MNNLVYCVCEVSASSAVPRKSASFFWQSRDREEAVFMSRACIRSLTVAALKDAAIARHYTSSTLRESYGVSSGVGAVVRP